MNPQFSLASPGKHGIQHMSQSVSVSQGQSTILPGTLAPFESSAVSKRFVVLDKAELL